MDTEQRLRQLTADFPGTPPPDPETLARVVKRGKRAALVHRVGVGSGVAALVTALALAVPPLLREPAQPPVIAPVVDEAVPAPAEDAEPEPTETTSDDPDETIEALATDEPSDDAAEPTEATTAAPTEEPRTVTVTAEPKPQPTATTPEPEPTTEPEPKPEPTATQTEPAPEPTATEPAPEPTQTATPLAPYEGFTVAVTTNQREYAKGSEPRIVVRACNTTDQVREQRHAQTGHRFDLWVKNADTGDWVADTTSRAYAQAVETVRWEPGQCREFVEIWHGTFGPIGEAGGEPVPAGNYQVKAKWMGVEGEVHLDYRYSPTFFLDGPSAPMPFEGFSVTVSTDKASYGYDEKVTFKIKACNTSGEAREQVIPHAGHWFDLYVKDAEGRVVADTTWRTYSGPASTVTFPAGACETWLESWWQCEGEVHSEPTGAHLPAGTYTAKVQWLGTEQGQQYGWAQSPAFQLTG